MKDLVFGFVRLGVVILAASMAAAPPAGAQGSSSSSLSGVVIDTGGGVVPGAAIVVKNKATNASFDTVTSSTGAFSVPALNPGTYTVTVTLMGFKTGIINDVKLLPATPADIKVILEIGNLEETVVVTGGTELVQTRTAAISSTVNVDQINNLPLPTRNAVNFVTFLPGVNTTGVNRDSNFNGLPNSAVAISLDGVNNNENFNKSTEGLFAMVTPRQDAVEAVTVTTAIPGSDFGGHGAVSIRFVTRSGTDRFTGSAYEYYRSPNLNTNYYFNKINHLPKNKVTLNQYGFRQGGPIVIPGLYNGRGKAFFFFNYEELRLPNEFTRTRTVLNPTSATGVFRYNVTVGGQQIVREVNLFNLARTYGQTPTADPTVTSVLASIRAAMQKTGNTTQTADPNTLQYTFLSPGNQVEKQPTLRLDYNLTSSNRLTGTWTRQVIDRTPDQLNSVDVRFPDAPNFRKYLSYRNLSSVALRSAITPSLVNDLRGGIKWGPSYFGKPEWNGAESFADQGGRALVFGNVGQTLTNYYTNFTPSARSAWSWNIDDTVNYQWRSHSLSMGGSYYDGYVWVTNQTMVPQVNFGVDDSDPANAMFTAANFPGAGSTQLANAKALYALLAGRVTTITADARLNEETNQYSLLGPRTQRLRQQEFGVFAQDLWRINQGLTVSAGIRWDVQLPIQPTNSIMSMANYSDLCGVSGMGSNGACNLFQPGTLNGTKPSFKQFPKGQPAYKTDWNNIAPNVGFAWQPGVQGGIGRMLLGDPDQATIRAGFSMAYNREGMALFTGVVGANPGSTISVVRSAALGNIVGAGQTWPVLLRDESRLGMPAFPSTPSYPLYGTVADSVNLFDANIQVPMARSITASFQRGLSTNMAVEVRYMGTWGRNIWTNYDYNEINIVENGFLKEFVLAQQNLQANVKAGRGSTFKYFGPGTGTAPLPTILAYFSGVPAAQSGDASKYTSSLFTNSTFLNTLAVNNPQPCCSTSSSTPSFAYNLFNNATRRNNAISAGLAPNFFVVNPDVGNAYIYKSDGFTSYNALQLEVRRRMSAGLQFSANYQYAIANQSRSVSQRVDLLSQWNVGVPRHALKGTWGWEIPVGRDKRFGGSMNRWLDTLIGGWEFYGAGRLQNRVLSLGNVRLVGMTESELGKAYGVRMVTNPETGVQTVWMFPDDIILNTRRAFNTDPTSATGYSALGVPEGRYIAPANGPACVQIKAGDCAPLNTYVHAPIFTRFDVSLVKKFRITGRVSFDLRLDVMNLFDNINFNDPGTLVGSGATMGQVTSAYTDNSNTFDPGGRLGQLVFRLNW